MREHKLCYWLPIEAALLTVSSIGYNVDEIAVQKMKEWYNTYGGMSQSELGEMQLGRDFEERGGKYYFYRQFDPLDMFMKDWTPPTEA